MFGIYGYILWLLGPQPTGLRCPVLSCRSLQSYEYSVWLWTKNWHSTTTSPELCERVTTIYAPCGIYVTKQNIFRLQRVQNSLARVVCFASYRSLTSRLRRRLHWLSVLERITFTIAMLTHKVLLHHQPGYISEVIVEHRPVYNLRSADNNLLVIPRAKTKIAYRAFRVSAPTIWNTLPLSLRSKTTTSSFRNKVNT